MKYHCPPAVVQLGKCVRRLGLWPLRPFGCGMDNDRNSPRAERWLWVCDSENAAIPGRRRLKPDLQVRSTLNEITSPSSHWNDVGSASSAETAILSHAATACLPQRNSDLSTHMRCRMTASLRATATRARAMPRRFATLCPSRPKAECRLAASEPFVEFRSRQRVAASADPARRRHFRTGYFRSDLKPARSALRKELRLFPGGEVTALVDLGRHRCMRWAHAASRPSSAGLDKFVRNDAHNRQP